MPMRFAATALAVAVTATLSMGALSGGAAAQGVSLAAVPSRGPEAAPGAFWTAVAARVGVSPDTLARAARDVRAERAHARREAFAAAVAARLGGGVTAGRVVAALKRARHRAVGRDALLDAAARDLGVPAERLHEALRAAAPARMAFARAGRRHLLADAARYLGMAPEELRDELGQGRSLAQVAVGHGRSAAGLEQALGDRLKARIHALVLRPWPRHGDDDGRGGRTIAT